MNTKELFNSFQEAVEYYRTETNIRYTETVSADEAARETTLCDDTHDYYVVVWPAKDENGVVDPVKVWAEEY